MGTFNAIIWSTYVNVRRKKDLILNLDLIFSVNAVECLEERNAFLRNVLKFRLSEGICDESGSFLAAEIYTQHIELSCSYLQLTRLYFQTQGIMGLHTHPQTNMIIQVVVLLMLGSRRRVFG